MQKRRAIFLDRDGVINHLIDDEKLGPRSPFTLDEFTYILGADEAVKILKQMDYDVFVVTNQPWVMMGGLSPEHLNDISNKIIEDLGIDDVLCALDKNSKLYKPRPGMIQILADIWNTDLENSWLIGDRWKDIYAADAAGITNTVLVGSDKYDVPEGQKKIYPYAIASSLLEAAKFIGEENGFEF